MTIRSGIRPLEPRRPWQVVPGVPLASFYTFAVLAIRTLFRVLCRPEVVGREHVPREGRLIVVSNHTHLLDPTLIGATLPRKVQNARKISAPSVRNGSTASPRAWPGWWLRRLEVAFYN